MLNVSSEHSFNKKVAEYLALLSEPDLFNSHENVLQSSNQRCLLLAFDITSLSAVQV